MKEKLEKLEEKKIGTRDWKEMNGNSIHLIPILDTE